MAIRFRQFVKNHRKAIGSGLVLFICAVVLVPQAVEAQWYKDVLDGFIMGVAWLVFFIAWLGGQLLVTLITILVWVASYNNFINEPIVSVGWTIIRDLCNMAFIIALLYMAFNMVFGIKKGGNLLTLIINAGLINFSKVISGFVIDISQVVMLTFVNGFYKIAGGNILEGLGFTKMFEMVKLGGTGGIDPNAIPGGDGPAGAGTVLISIVFALILIYIAVGMVLTFIIMLIGRIFKLWGLLITSPVPFVKKILPGMPDVGGGGGNYWGELAKTAAAGPILAFWLWLIFTSVSLYNRVYVNTGFTGSFGDSPAGSPESLIQGGGGGVGWSQAGTLTNIMSYIIFIGLMMLALQQAQSQANAMHSIVGNAAKKLRGGAHNFIKKAPGRAWDLSGAKARYEGWREAKKEAWRLNPNKFLGVLDRNKVWENFTKEGRKVRDTKLKAKTKGATMSRFAQSKLKDPRLAAQYRDVYTYGNLVNAQSSDTYKKLKDSKQLESKEDALFQFQQALQRKDQEGAFAIAYHVVEKGWLGPDVAMRKLRKTFNIKKDGELDKRLSEHMEGISGKAEGTNKFTKKSRSRMRREKGTNNLMVADAETRVSDAHEEIMDGDVFDVMDAFKNDYSFNPADIADEKDEVVVALGNLDSLAQLVIAQKGRLQTREGIDRFLKLWSDGKRKRMKTQIDQVIGLAERHHVGITPDQRKHLEALSRLMSIDREALYHQEAVTGKGGQKVVQIRSNLGDIIGSVDQPAGATKVSKKKTDAKGNTIAGTDVDVVVEDASIANLAGTGTVREADRTRSANENIQNFERGLLKSESDQMRINRDEYKNENEKVVDELMQVKYDANDVEKARLENALRLVEKLKSEITNDQPKTQAELLRLERDIDLALNDPTSGLYALFSNTNLTNVVDGHTGQKLTERQVFEQSHLFKRLREMMSDLKTKVSTPPTIESGAFSGVAVRGIRGYIEKGYRKLAGDSADPNIQFSSGIAAQNAYEYSIGEGLDRQTAVASGLASGRAYAHASYKGIGARANEAGFAARAAGEEFVRSREQFGDEPTIIAFRVAKNALLNAGFRPEEIVGIDRLRDEIEKYYSEEQARGGDQLSILKKVISRGIGYVVSESSILRNRAASDFGTSVVDGMNQYVEEVDNGMQFQKASDASEAASSVYEKSIKSGKSMSVAQSDAVRAVVAGGYDQDIAEQAISDAISNADLSAASYTFNKKEKSAFDNSGRGAYIQLDRVVRTPKGEAYKEEEKILGRWRKFAGARRLPTPLRVTGAHEHLHQALSDLSDASATQSATERQTKLQKARQAFASAQRGLYAKYGHDPYFVVEFEQLLNQFNGYGDFSGNLDEQTNKHLTTSIQRVINNYVK